MPTYSFYLRDPDLIAMLEAEPNQSAAIRQALRAYYANEDKMLTELREIKALLVAGAMPAEPAGDDQVDASAIDEAMKGW